jgi:DNA-binding response OmpR family regulator
VKTYVAYLRQSFRENAGVELPIETVRGFGYRYKPPKGADEIEGA